MKLLLIEDNESVSSMLSLFFEKEGFKTTFSTDGIEGLQLAQSQQWDCLIIDWMLPSLDGIQICKQLRQAENDVPIILLTAKTEEQHQLEGFSVGADDYVTKPFSPVTLLARIKAVTRRANKEQPSSDSDNILRSHHFIVNLTNRQVMRDGEEIHHLTPKEFDLLCFFLQHPQQVLSRDQLLDHVWGYDFYGDDRTVDVHIKRLRSKVSTATHPFFHTVWGVGYQFDENRKEGDKK